MPPAHRPPTEYIGHTHPLLFTTHPLLLTTHPLLLTTHHLLLTTHGLPSAAFLSHTRSWLRSLALASVEASPLTCTHTVAGGVHRVAGSYKWGCSVEARWRTEVSTRSSKARYISHPFSSRFSISANLSL